MEYYSEQALKELQRRKHEAEMLREAWGNVSRLRTKEGEEFKTLSKNFKFATIKPKTYTPSEKEIYVVIQDDKGHTFSDSIDIDKTVYSDSKEAYEYEQQGRLKQRGAWLHPYVSLNVDEICDLINKRIDYYDRQIKELSDVIDNYEEIAQHLVALRDEAQRYLKTFPASAYYVLRSIVREERL